MFETELKRNGLTMADVLDEDVLPHILRKLSVPSMDELYAAIGYGGQTAVRSVNRVKDELSHIKRPEKKTVLDKINEQAEKRVSRPQKACTASWWRAWTTASSNSPSAAPPCRGTTSWAS